MGILVDVEVEVEERAKLGSLGFCRCNQWACTRAATADLQQGD